MSSEIDLQRSIVNNAEELKQFIQELKVWEEEIKDEDRKLTSKNQQCPSESLPPVRGKGTAIISKKHNDQSGESSNEMKRTHSKETSKPKRISGSDYAAWDKFDAEAAVISSTDEESEAPKAARQNISAAVKSDKVPDEKEDTSKNVKSVQGVSLAERANIMKEQGNKLYAQQKYEDAVAKYTQGIGLDPSNAILPANRAMACIKLEKFAAAEADCTTSINLDPTYVKAYLRRGTVRRARNDYQRALEDFKKVLELEPWNKDAKREATKLRSRLGIKDEKRAASDKYVAIPVSHTEPPKRKEVNTMDGNSSAGSSKRDEDTSGVIQPVEKSVHLRSQVPLTRLEVRDVKTLKELEKLRGEVSSSPVPEVASVSCEKQKEKSEAVSGVTDKCSPEVPHLVPHTSHQFSQGWQKVADHHDVAIAYLKKIPTIFLEKVELDTDDLVQVVDTLSKEDVDTSFAVNCFSSLTKTPGFNLSLAFLEPVHKTVFNRLLAKLEGLLSSSIVDSLHEALR